MKTTTESDYQKQAREFMEKTKTEMTAVFSYHGKHFDDDKDLRDVYRITLKRGEKEYSFNFGQSIAQSTNGKEKHIETCKPFHQWGEPCFKPSHRIKPSAPTVYDVLACLTKYDPGSFRNFCASYGYSDDSIKARKVYFAVQEEWENVNRLFSDVLEELAEIQ